MKVRLTLSVLSCMLLLCAFASSSQARTRDQRAAGWNKAVTMKYRQQTARANGSAAPHWPSVRCIRQCAPLIAKLARQRLSAEREWNHIRYGTDTTAVKKIIRYWFSRGGQAVLVNAFTVADCENSFVAANGPSPTGDWGAWQIHLSAHPDVSQAQAEDPWYSTMWSWRASSRGTDFSPTWTCATIHGLA